LALPGTPKITNVYAFPATNPVVLVLRLLVLPLLLYVSEIGVVVLVESTIAIFIMLVVLTASYGLLAALYPKATAAVSGAMGVEGTPLDVEYSPSGFGFNETLTTRMAHCPDASESVSGLFVKSGITMICGMNWELCPLSPAAITV
jgi:hypothetical protein